MCRNQACSQCVFYMVIFYLELIFFGFSFRQFTGTQTR